MRKLFFLGLIGYGFTMLGAAEPQWQQIPVFIGGLDSIAEYRIPGIVTTNEGTLVAACDARVDRPGDPINNIDIALKRSTDSGRTWEPMRRIVDFPGRQAAADSCIAYDRQAQKVWLFYDYVLEEPAASGTRVREKRIVALHAVSSDDDGRTWSKPKDLTPSVKLAEWEAIMVGPGRGSQTRDGRLLVPCYSQQVDNDYTHVLVSDDHGSSWRVSNAAGSMTNESAVVELVDGSWLVNMRSGRRHGYRVFSTSVNAGQQWETLRDATELPGPCCQGSLIRYTDVRSGYQKNRLLFSNPADSSQRRNMTVRLSYDEGKTWPVSKVIYPGPTAYSCLTVLQDGTIGLLFENGEKSPYEKITFARFNLEWLSDGSDRLAVAATE